MSAGPLPPDASRRDPKAVWGWSLYDFANSAYTTLIVTFIYAVFFTQEIAEDAVTGTAQWANAVAVTGIIVALSSPVLGALADGSGRRKAFLAASTVVCVAAVGLMYFAESGQVLLALSLFVVSNVAFELSGVFYNSYLPEVAPRGRIGRVSGYGWALGYLGGFLAMVLALVALIQPENPWFGIPTDRLQNVRAATVLVALWFGLFSIPMFFWVHDPRGGTRRPGASVVGDTVRQLAATFREIRRYRNVAWLLVARLVYNDGLVTIFAFGPIYAAGTFDFSLEEVMVWGLALNVTAGLGSVAMGILDDRIGGKRTILISIAGLIAGSLAAVLATSKGALWVAGLAAGLFVGPNQAASRSLLGRFVPKGKETEFFGFFAFSGKATAFMGPLLLGVVTALFQSQRLGMATILLFFTVGGLLLRRVNEAEGIAVARDRGGTA